VTESPSGAGEPNTLEGLRIVGIGHWAAVPYAMSLLGDLGADVINIEGLEGDTLRKRDNVFPELSSYFIAVNRSKRSVSLNLKSQRGIDTALRLLATADAVVENFRPGLLDSIGLGYDHIRAIKPDIVHLSVTPWGPAGPERDRPGMDLLAQARGGMMSLTGISGQPPVRIPPPIADYTSAYLVTIGLLTGLIARDRHGIGQHIDVSLLGGQVFTLGNLITLFAETGKPDGPMGSTHPQLVPYQPFSTKSGYLIVACLTERMWQGMCGVIGRPDLAGDPRFVTNADRIQHAAALTEILQAEFLRAPAEDWEAALEGAGVPAGKIQSLADVLADPQVLHNDYVVRTRHPVVGEVTIPGVPIKFAAMPGAITRPAAMLGEHTREVLADIGMNAEEIDQLLTAGDALETPPTTAAARQARA
jgi:crotonobetainyl-CoA:carnitine CoA-transferase CaiB-like acyl-CoA transferase